MWDVSLASGVSPAMVLNTFDGRSGRLRGTQRDRILSASLSYFGPHPASRRACTVGNRDSSASPAGVKYSPFATTASPP